MLHGISKNKLLLSALLLSSLPTMANVVNGNFEQWTGNTPQAWTVIDSGINVSANSAVVSTGLQAAAISVNTGTQSNTDFLQQVAVEMGKTYEFSVDVYHTEGHLKARLFIDGYQGYSNPALTNQWQTITYSYTADSSKTIDVGLRFYDTSGFDGSELVYVDNFYLIMTAASVLQAAQITALLLT